MTPSLDLDATVTLIGCCQCCQVSNTASIDLDVAWLSLYVYSHHLVLTKTGPWRTVDCFSLLFRSSDSSTPHGCGLFCSSCAAVEES